MGESAHSTDASANDGVPTSTMRRRPTASLTGPISSCPTAKATRNAVSVSWATPASVPRSAASSGSPGMYMSVASGEMPVTTASGTSGASSRPPVRGWSGTSPWSPVHRT